RPTPSKEMRILVRLTRRKVTSANIHVLCAVSNWLLCALEVLNCSEGAKLAREVTTRFFEVSNKHPISHRRLIRKVFHQKQDRRIRVGTDAAHVGKGCARDR